MDREGLSMDDLISRQAAIDETWKEPSYTDPYNVLTEVRERIQSLPSAQPQYIARDIATIIENEKDMRVVLKQPRWIPCSERLPEVNREILVTEKGGFIRHCEYANYGDFQEFQTVEEGMTVDDVIAWMPLPPSFKEDES